MVLVLVVRSASSTAAFVSIGTCIFNEEDGTVDAAWTCIAAVTVTVASCGNDADGFVWSNESTRCSNPPSFDSGAGVALE
jgi:hypothetical protein